MDEGQVKSTLIVEKDLDRYLKIRELVKDYPNDMEFGSKVRELFWERDTAGYPVKMIDKWVSRDIDKAVMIDEDTQVDHQDSDWHEWVCDICGKNTYNVEYDYLGSGTNHLGCELEIEMKNKHDE